MISLQAESQQPPRGVLRHLSEVLSEVERLALSYQYLRAQRRAAAACSTLVCTPLHRDWSSSRSRGSAMHVKETKGIVQ